MGGLLSVIPILINNTAKPRMELLPGMDIGNKNGDINRMHDKNMPLSPVSSRKSLKVIPSSEIFEEISLITLEKFLVH